MYSLQKKRDNKVLSKIKFVIIILASSLIYSACNLDAPDSGWYVSPDGNDNNSCMSAQDACQTIQGAIDKASPEGLVIVMGGNYQENLLIGEHNLEIRGEGIETTIIDGGGNGSVISINSSTLILGDVTVTNSGENDAGIVAENSRVIVNNALIVMNDYGIQVYNSNLTVSNSSINSNSNRGILVDDSQGGIVNSNIAGNVIGIHSTGESELNISNSTISGSLNTGIEISHSSIVFISTSTISDNFGSGVRVLRQIVAAVGTVENPDPVGVASPDGCPEVIISNSAIHNNIAFPLNGQESLGGGLFNDSCASVTITNTTLSSNQARLGGGIYNSDGGQIAVTNSTIAVNSATEQGGGIFNSGEMSILNSILALNTGVNCSSPISSSGFNIDSGGTCGFNGNGDQSNIDALLDSTLRDNGGFSMTHKLFEGSPAINAIQGDCPATDQRGIERPQGDGCDIGAFEDDESPITIQTTPQEIVPLSTDTPPVSGLPTVDASPTVTADQDANCRTGPDQAFQSTSFLLANQSASIVGRNSSSSWWVIEISNGTCWIWDGTVTVSGDISEIPVITSPAKPTPTPTATPIALTAPKPISPTGDSNCVGFVNQAFSWQAATGDVASYHLVVQKSSTDASGPFESYTDGNTNGLSLSKDITCDSLAYYRWRVRAVDSQGGNGPWSDWMAFRAYP